MTCSFWKPTRRRLAPSGLYFANHAPQLGALLRGAANVFTGGFSGDSPTLARTDFLSDLAILGYTRCGSFRRSHQVIWFGHGATPHPSSQLRGRFLQES